MATTATRNANTVYISSATGVSDVNAVTSKNVIVYRVTLSGVGAATTITLKDVSTGLAKFFAHAASGATSDYDFSGAPLLFPNGVTVSISHVDAIASLIVRETGS